MEKAIKQIQKGIQNDLAKAATGYLKLGLSHYHEKRSYFEFYPQVLVGNLAIAVELMLKSFIAGLSLDLLYTGLPLELRSALAAPSNLPSDFRFRPYEIELSGTTYRMLDLSQCISIFGTYFRKDKKQLGSHLKFLRECRNASVHGVLPSFQKYELDRSVYLSLRLHEILKQAKALGFFSYSLTPEDKQFLKEFDDQRIIRVQNSLAQAREKAKSVEGTTLVGVNGWESFTTSCPACGCEGVLSGDTDVDPPADSDDHPHLTFFAYSFECEDCGLTLRDTQELELAGMKVVYDRDTELPEWFHQHYPED